MDTSMSGFFVILNVVLGVMGFLVSVTVPLVILHMLLRMLSGRHTSATVATQTPRKHHAHTSIGPGLAWCHYSVSAYFAA